MCWFDHLHLIFFLRTSLVEDIERGYNWRQDWQPVLRSLTILLIVS